MSNHEDLGESPNSATSGCMPELSRQDQRIPESFRISYPGKGTLEQGRNPVPNKGEDEDNIHSRSSTDHTSVHINARAHIQILFV